MDRRHFLTLSLVGAAAPTMSWAQQAAQSAPPPFPPVDARSVWLVGDSAPPDPERTARRLVELAQRGGKPRDSYLANGAVADLEARFAKLLGKEDCAFLATGTLANHLAARVLAGDASRVIVPRESHLYRDESDATQLLSGLNLVPLADGRAAPGLAEIKAAVDEAENGPYPLRVGAIVLESPVRRVKGEMVAPALIREIAAYARGKNIRLHLDGARLLLAPPGYDIAGAAALFDTVYVSLYKYLDAPFGAVLAGGKADIAKVRDLRHRFGGTIYQGWPCAILALAALDDFEARHRAAFAAADQLFAALKAQGLATLKPAPNASNIRELVLAPKSADGLFDRMRQAGVRMARAENGVAPIYINDTLTRRPVEEYVKLFAG
ncbi:low specificity L-threonine aldolase [Caulobacter sp. UNC279MFTsu5.1]|uniref:threonine aldolase family protein n=1 Tax=Caulobacter sp. UNC279MFTsu5.1 TaxID=1502775 RepID=UPI0008E19D0E|nr:beta-eliminating lyase-related protein [Caulobacter sp. UNC279MFTsu5.1]SFI95851.1 L-threonine aldolase [Caulobacter sp. UNC279MFTsu5.1]